VDGSSLISGREEGENVNISAFILEEQAKELRDQLDEALDD
jgi:hypothetical protein